MTSDYSYWWQPIPAPSFARCSLWNWKIPWGDMQRGKTQFNISSVNWQTCLEGVAKQCCGRLQISFPDCLMVWATKHRPSFFSCAVDAQLGSWEYKKLNITVMFSESQKQRFPSNPQLWPQNQSSSKLQLGSIDRSCLCSSDMTFPWIDPP